ncbi:hypothetical protein EAI_07709, partial [Harpegnathos saltator]
SGPLTLYYGMQNVKLLNLLRPRNRYCVIHIMAANYIDKKYLPAWEFILHLYPVISDLRIVLIGPELDVEKENINTCSACNIKYLKLSFETHSMLYHQYVNSQWYKQPNLIVAFQADLSIWGSLSESIFKLREQNCPFLLTAKSKLKADENINKIEEILSSPLNFIYHDSNKFSSYKPYRDYTENGGVSHRNKYLSIFL